MRELKAMEDRVTMMEDPLRTMFAGSRKINYKWKLLFAEVNARGWKGLCKKLRKVWGIQ